MPDDQDTLAEQLLLRVLELPPEERAAALRERCGDDHALAERLLARLEGDTVVDPGRAPGAGGSDDDLPPPRQRIGPYHIKGVIASGGMGTVYEAMQEQPRRRVALKVMKAGIASRSTMRRFEYEVQFLARLRHPGIAQIYEAGKHDDPSGPVPYFAMEYIPNARSITEYADVRKLGVRERLELIVAVCDAVHHGHQKGVIHRDLKPANILVDSSGQPKVIDFGVARATDADMAITTQQTDVGQLVGTLQYMSPEQCEADPSDIDTRSDVYALGVVLYELLCGELPYDLSRAPVYEAARIIRTEPPVRPSTLSRQLRGDIETVTLKALEKERDRRYQSAADLGQDIRRYLANQPIEARPPSLTYQIRMFARRNRAVFGALAAVIMTLVIAVVVSSIFGINAELSRRDAVAAGDILAEKETNLQRSLAAEREAHTAADAATEKAQAAEREQRRQSAITHRSLAQVARERGDWEAVRDNVRSALELGAEDPIELLLWDVEAVWDTVDEPGAIVERLEAIEARPDAAGHAGAIALWRTFAQFDPKLTPGRMRELVNAARVHPLSEADQALADAMLAETVPETVEGLRQALAHDPIEPRSLSRLASGLILLDEYEEAEQLCRVWIARQPESAKAWQYLAVTHARRGEIDPAVEIVEERFPRSADTRTANSKTLLIESLHILVLFREAENILMDPGLTQELQRRILRYTMQSGSFTVSAPSVLSGSLFGLQGKNNAPAYLEALTLSVSCHMQGMGTASPELLEEARELYRILPNDDSALVFAFQLESARLTGEQRAMLRRHIERRSVGDRWTALSLTGLLIDIVPLASRDRPDVSRPEVAEQIEQVAWFTGALLENPRANPAMVAVAIYASAVAQRPTLMGWGFERLLALPDKDISLYERAAQQHTGSSTMRMVGLILAAAALPQAPDSGALLAVRDEVTATIDARGAWPERDLVRFMREAGLLPPTPVGDVDG